MCALLCVIFAIGLGCLLFILPQGLVGRYQPLSTSNGLTDGQVCRLGVNGTSEFCFADYGGQWYYILIFFMAQLLMGAGTTPLYTLGPAYIDENVHPKSSPVYLAVFFSLTLLGPGLGFISGGSLLNIYIDITQVNMLSYLCLSSYRMQRFSGFFRQNSQITYFKYQQRGMCRLCGGEIWASHFVY